MKHFFKALSTAVLLLSATAGFGQSHTLEGFSGVNKSAIMPIYEKNEVKGYTMYYKADKAAKNLDNYGVTFFDQDLNKVKTITMQKPSNSHILIRSCFNGNTFGFYFYNGRKGYVELETYDRSLTKIATKVLEDLSRYDNLMATQDIGNGLDNENNPMGGLNFYPVPDKGFIRNRYTGTMKGFGLEMFDNALNLKWRYETDKKEKGNASIMVNEVTDQYLLATITRRPSALSQKMTFSIAAFDIETGKKLFEKPVESKATEQLSLSSVSFDKAKNEIMVVGEFYRLDDKPFVNKSLGFFVKGFTTSGEETVAKFYAWDNQVRALMPAAAKASIEKSFVNYIHKVHRGADGNLYLVAEQYKVAGRGAGIAGAMLLGGSTSLMHGLVGNMLIFSLDPSYTLTQVKFFEKDESKAVLPTGVELMGAGLIGHIMKAYGGFDYQFTQTTQDASAFSLAFFNHDKEKGEKTKKKLVNVVQTPSQEFNTDVMDVTSTKESYSLVYPAKPGYNMVVEVQSKQKKLEMKLVKLTQ